MSVGLGGERDLLSRKGSERLVSPVSISRPPVPSHSLVAFSEGIRIEALYLSRLVPPSAADRG